MKKKKQQLIKVWSEEIVMVRGILKEVYDEAVERIGRREELEQEIEVIYKVIEEEEKQDGGKTVQEKDLEGKGMTRLEVGGGLRKRKKTRGNKWEEKENKITKYYKRKGRQDEDLLQKKKQRLGVEEGFPPRLQYQTDLTRMVGWKEVVAKNVVEEIVSVGWELLERRERARTRMGAWKSARSIVDYILEMAVVCEKLPECGTELSGVEGGSGLSHCQEGTVRADGGAECGEGLGQSQDCLSVTDITMQELDGSSKRCLQSDRECGFGLGQLVGPSVAESSELSVKLGPSVATGAELDKLPGGGVVQQKLDSFFQTFPNLRKLEANIKLRNNEQKQSKKRKKPILGGGTTSRGSRGNGGQRVKGIREYFENLQTNSGKKRKMGVGGVESGEENSILGSDHKRFKNGASLHMQAARASLETETSAVIGRNSLVKAEQPIISDEYLNLESIGHAAAS